ncbi:MAG: hypothetical protein AB1348_08060, partial [Nitrospirota bacterium]
FLFLFPSLSYAIGAVGVKPMTIDLELSPNQKGEFQIDVYSTSPKEDTPVHLSLFDAVQKEDGTMDFVDVGKNPYSCTPWIKLEKTDFTVLAGETVTVKGEIFVPRAKSGSRIATIMVEPGYEKKKTGITVRVRYAVVLKLKIKGRTVVENAKLERFGIKRLENGTPAIEAVILNKSEIDFTAKGRALIQDSSGKIITSINLTTESFERKKKDIEKEKEKKFKDKDKAKEEEQRLYPGSKVAFFGKFDKPMSPGEYTAILSMKYGKRSLTAKEKIKLTEEDIASLAVKKPVEGASFEIKPANLEIKSPPGGVRSSFFSITNITEMPIKVTLSLKDIEYSPDGETIIKEKGSTPYSASEWIELEKAEYMIGPRLSQTVSMRIKVPESAQPGGRYAQVVVEESKGEAKNFVEIGVIVPGRVEPVIEIKRFERVRKDIGAEEFVLDVKNSCAMHLVPKGRVVIKDIYNNEVEQVELKLKARAILPQTVGRMTGEIKKKLIPGEYTANVEIDYGGKERATSKLSFVIK